MRRNTWVLIWDISMTSNMGLKLIICSGVFDCGESFKLAATIHILISRERKRYLYNYIDFCIVDMIL